MARRHGGGPYVGPGRACNDGRHAILDSGHRHNHVRTLRWRRRARPSLRPHHRTEYWNGDQFSHGGDRGKYDRQTIGRRLRFLQIDCGNHRVGRSFPFVTPLLVRASNTIDGVTLLAAYHTAYNVVGVAVLLPLIDKFTRFVERILPERGSPLTRCLDPLALSTPIAAVEAVRRTVARALEAACHFGRRGIKVRRRRRPLGKGRRTDSTGKRRIAPGAGIHVGRRRTAGN